MSDLFVVGLLVVGLVVLVMAVLQVGMLREIGKLRMEAEMHGAARPPIPSFADDGPALTTCAPTLTRASINGYGDARFHDPEDDRELLVVMISALCNSCQKIVAPINEAIASRGMSLRTVVVISGDTLECEAILNIFPLHTAVLIDEGMTIAQELTTHHNPFALLYDGTGQLTGKGVIETAADVSLLLGAIPVTEGHLVKQVVNNREAPEQMVQASA